MPRSAIDNPSWSLRSGHTAPLPVAESIDWHPWIPIAGKLGWAKGHKPKRRLSDYINRDQQQVPLAVARPHPGLVWQMFLNDKIGDCVIAMMLHAIMDFNAEVLNPVPVFTDQDAESWYELIGGYKPSDPSTDGGCDENVAMGKWQAGLTDHAGVTHTIKDTLAVNPQDLVECRLAIYEFVAIMGGVALPQSAQGQSEWAVVGDPATNPAAQPGSWGGHGIPIREYDQNDFKVVTWGAELLMTVPFHQTYMEECHVVVTEEMLSRNSGQSVTGLSWDDLAADLRKDLKPAQAEQAEQEEKPKPKARRKKVEEPESEQGADDTQEQEDPGEAKSKGSDESEE